MCVAIMWGELTKYGRCSIFSEEHTFIVFYLVRFTSDIDQQNHEGVLKSSQALGA